MPTRVLIVEDQEITRGGMGLLLGAAPGLAVVGAAETAKEAAELFEKESPDVVIIDIELPDGDGIDLIKKLRSTSKAAKYVVFTGNNRPEQVWRALDAGATGFVMKSSLARELVAAIEAVAKGGSYLCTRTLSHLRDSDRKIIAKETVHIPDREKEVLRLVVRGLRNKEIAAELGIGVKSVETYRSRLMKRTGCTSPADLVRYALKEGLAAL